MKEVTDSEINKLIYAFIGAIAALLLNGLKDRITYARKLNRVRKYIIKYIDNFVLDRLDRLIEDNNRVITYLSSKDESDYEKLVSNRPDVMPMLTSEIFKSADQPTLHDMCYTTKNYLILTNGYYCIEYLKSGLAGDIFKTFVEKVNEHIEKKELKTSEAKKEHFQTCNQIASWANQSIGFLKSKIDVANSIREDLYNLSDNLKGNNFIWILKYSFR